MPVYNTELYLETAILSVLKQSYKDFELICIDDCSTDSSSEILEKYSNLDSRIKIFKNESNRGAAYCRNRGLEISKGEYIFFLDSDDWINFNTFEILENFSRINNLDILMFKFITYWDESNTFSIEPFYDMKFMDQYIDKIFNHTDIKPNLLFDIPGANCNKLYSKEFLIKINLKFPEGLMFEDTAVFFEYMLKAKRVSLINEYFYNRRRRKNSVMTTTGKKLLDIITIANDLVEVFFEDIENYNIYKNGLLNITFSMLKGKYNLINDEFKEEYLQKSSSLIQKLNDKYNIIYDIEDNLNKNNLEFYNKLKLNETKLYTCDLENFTVSLGKNILIKDLKITKEFTNIFLNNNTFYENHKENLLTFIFEKLKEKCLCSEDNIKEKNFQQCKYLVNKLYSEFDLYPDIKNYVNPNLIDFFNQDFI